MGRKVIVFIVLIALTMISACGSVKGINGVDCTAKVINNEKRLEIHEKLRPRQYEGYIDSTMITIIAGESIDTIPEWCFSKIPILKEFIIKGENVFVE